MMNMMMMMEMKINLLLQQAVCACVAITQ